MSLTGITWSPVKTGNQVDMHNAAVGSTWDMLCKVFGSSRANTITLTIDDCGKLDAMHTVTGKEESVFSELSKLVAEYDEIEIEAW